jgi:hypothetical protein
MKRVIVRLTPEAEEVYQYLKIKVPDSKQEEVLLNAFLQKVELIKRNFQYGQPIAKNLIPSDYKTKYGITNLFRVELPLFWRMLYTLMDGDSDDETLVIVVDLIDHRKYNKKFGYKN